MSQQKSDINKTKMLQGPVGKTLISLTIPMALGVVTLVLFTVINTFYIGRLGTEPLAAMGFILPITYIVLSIGMGLNAGTASTIARAIGEEHQLKVRRLATDGLGLVFLIVTCVSLIGLTNLNTIFSLIGAKGEILEHISHYMIPWCLCVGLLVIPMVGNGAIRATGDTKTPATIMITAAIVNAALDPLLIFGLGPFPRLELRGAAFTAAISWSVAFTMALWILGKRERMIQLPVFDPKRTFDSWKQILYIGIPAAATHIMEPLSAAVLTRMISKYGEAAVAAFGVGDRLEALSVIGIWALAAAMTPLVGQNLGAGNYDRIRAALRFGVKFSLVWGGVMFIVLYVLSGVIAPIFSNDKTVIASIILFLQIVPISYAIRGISRLVNSMFNALGKPLQASLVVILQIFVLVLPLAYLGSKVYGLKGIFIGMVVGNAVGGIIAYLMIQKFLVRLEAAHESAIT